MKNPIFSILKHTCFCYPIAFLFLLISLTLHSQSVVLDPSFSVSTNGSIKSHLLQTDGKILITGGLITTGAITNTWIARLNSNGTLESNFKADSIIKGIVNCARVQTDGKIVLGGNFSSTSWPVGPRNRLARINPNGTLDSNFMNNQGFDNMVQSLVIQPDGKIIVAGFFSSFNNFPSLRVARLDSNGTYDNTFVVGTSFDSDVFPIALQTDGKIIMGGNFNSYNGIPAKRIIRLNSNGSADASFNTGSGFNGPAAYYGTSKILIQPDGKIIACGTFTNYNGSLCNNIVRINPNGSIDTSFHSGTGADGDVRDVILQSNGKIILGGSFSNYDGHPASKIVRLTSNGQFDNTFNTGSGFDAPVRLQLQSDDKILCSGNITLYNGLPCKPVVRLMNVNTTSLEENSKEKGLLIYPNPAKDKLIIDFTENGKKRILNIKLSDESAKIIKSENFSEEQKFELEIGSIKDGIYFVSIYENDTLLWTQKVIKVE